MENEIIRVPFDIELAKRITRADMPGKIMNLKGDKVRIIEFEAKNHTPIVAKVCSQGRETIASYTSNGFWCTSEEPSDKDLCIEVDRCFTFKDGDIIGSFDVDESGRLKRYISILKGNVVWYYWNIYFEAYVSCVYEWGRFEYTGELLFNKKFNYKPKLIKGKEKNKLIEMLQASEDPKAKEYLLRFFGILTGKVPSCEFTTGQPVLGKDGSGQWRYDLFSHYNPQAAQGKYVCTGRSYTQCLPYNEETKHLVGTTAEIEVK